MITDLPFPPIKKQSLLKITRVSNAPQTHEALGRSGLVQNERNMARKNNRKWKFVFSTALSTSLPSQALFPLQWLFAAPDPPPPPPPPPPLITHRHTHTQYISFSHGTGRCTVCIIEIDPVIQLHTTKKTAQKSSLQLQPDRGHCQGQRWRPGAPNTPTVMNKRFHILPNVLTIKAYNEVCSVIKKKKPTKKQKTNKKV